MINFKKLALWIGLVILYIVMQIIAPILLDIFNIKNELIVNISLLIFDIITLITFILLYKNEFKEAHTDFNKNAKEKVKSTYMIWLCGLGFMIFSNTIINNILSGIANNEALNRSVLDKYTIYAIPTMIIIAPIIEEIIFRLSLKRVFKNENIFIVASGLLFGLAHVIGTSGLELLYIISYGGLGIALAYIYTKNKNILCSILAHMTHNFICVMLILFI